METAIGATTFIGRGQEMADVRLLIDRSRLVTLTGTGGAGKTRLAVELAAVHEDAHLVELAPVSDSALVTATVAESLGVPESAGTGLADALCAELRSRPMLLVLDNCEHVLDACRDLATRLLVSTSALRILATSRQALSAPGETSYPVPPLTTPAPQEQADPEIHDSVRLFVDRGRQARKGFELGEQNATAVGSICRRLDGIPLAIELAAARLNVLGPLEIDERLADRFALLTRGEPGALPRQRTLRALVDWSYDLLSADQQTLLARMSVFAGGCDIEGAESVCAGGSGESEASRRSTSTERSHDDSGGPPDQTDDDIDPTDVLDLVAELVERSLVQVDERGGRARYRLLETIREYATEKLSLRPDAQAVRRSHGDRYVRLAREIYDEQYGAEQKWIERISTEHDNIRAALGFVIESGDAESAQELASAVWRFWHLRGMLTEGRRWLERALALGASPWRARAANVSGNMAVAQRDLDAALPLYEEALELRRKAGDGVGLATTLNDLGVLWLHRGEFDSARRFLEESLETSKDLEEQGAAPENALTNLGAIAHTQQDWPAAREYYEKALVHVQRLDRPWHVAAILSNLGDVLSHEGRFDEARRHFAESVEYFIRLDDRAHLPTCVESLAGLTHASGDHRGATRLYAAAERMREEWDVPLPEFRRSDHESDIGELRDELGPEFDAAWAAGREMSLDQVRSHASADVPSSEPTEHPSDEATFRRQGEYWTITFEGRSFSLRDAKGMQYLRVLLADPGREFHCAELASTGQVATAAGSTEGLAVAAGDAGAILDPEAKAAYHRRLSELRAMVAEAESWGDAARASSAQTEIDSLAAELAAAFGLGGRERKGADTVERIRKAVTNRIKASQAKIAHEHPSLGRHLANAVRTGVFCSYVPDRPVDWST